MDIEGVYYCSRCMLQIEEEEICPHCGYDHRGRGNASPALEIGTLLKERYQLGSVIGTGGFGITYAAWDETLQIPVAIKEFYPEGYVDRDLDESDDVLPMEKYRGQYFIGMEHFMREARVLSMLSEMPGTVKVHDYFEENETAYLVMEYLRGKTLADYLKENRISGKEALTMIRKVIDALAALHRQGILHRDITPSNIMVLPDGSMKLIDFGSATQMSKEQSMVVATRRYAPVEQYDPEGKQLGAWTDIYSLCAVLYEMISGNCIQDCAARLQKDTAVPLNGTSSGLKKYQIRAIMDGLIPEPEKRIQSMEEFRSRLYNLPLPEEVRRRRKFMRRVTGISAAVLAAAVLCGFNFSTGLPLGDKLLYSLHSDGFHVYRSSGELSELVLPESKFGIPVVEIREKAFENERNLKKVVLPGSVKEVGAMAFYGCSFLEEAELKDGVEILKEYAFANCPSLRTVKLPESILYLNDQIFDGNSEYLTVWGIKDGKAEKAAESAGITFAANSDYVIEENGEGTAAIVVCADEDAEIRLPSVIDGKKVTEIRKTDAETAFFSCEQMECVYLPEYLETVPEYFFYNMLVSFDDTPEQKVKKVVFSPYLKSTGKSAFNLSDLEEVVLPEGLEVIEENTFFWSDLKEIVIPESVKRIEQFALANTELKELILPDSVEELGISAFGGCQQLQKVVLSENIEVIPNMLFSGCSSLTELLLPENVREIGAGAFESCGLLEYMEIPEKVTEIGNSTFSGCVRLKYVYIPESVTSISDSAFDMCSNELVIGGKSGSEAERFAKEHNITFDAEDLWEENVIFPERGTVYLTDQADRNVILPTYDKEHHTLVRSVGAESLPDGLISVQFPIWAERIEDYTFSNDRHDGKTAGLKEIVLPETLTYIGSDAFLGCESLKELNLPEGLQEIGHGAFFCCMGLETLMIPDTLIYLNQQSFEYCISLKEARIYADNVPADTAFVGGPFTLCENLTIYAHEGSAAQEYAMNCGIPFEIIE